jgi:hypothetical protein
MYIPVWYAIDIVEKNNGNGILGDIVYLNNVVWCVFQSGFVLVQIWHIKDIAG